MSFRRSKLSRLSVVLLGAGLAVAIIVLVGSTLSSSVSSSVENARESVGWLLDATPEVLYVTGEPGLAVTVEYVAVLDWREHRWEDGPYSIESDGSLDMEVEVPADAFLHSAAVDYVTELYVFVDFDGHRMTAPPTFLVWPDGEDQDPEIWGVAEQESLAPSGVVSSELRGSAATTDWVVPDVGEPTTTARALTTSSSRATSDTGVAE